MGKVKVVAFGKQLEKLRRAEKFRRALALLPDKVECGDLNLELAKPSTLRGREGKRMHNKCMCVCEMWWSCFN